MILGCCIMQRTLTSAVNGIDLSAKAHQMSHDLLATSGHSNHQRSPQALFKMHKHDSKLVYYSYTPSLNEIDVNSVYALFIQISFDDYPNVANHSF